MKMRAFREQVKEYFNFSLKEKWAVLILCCVIAIIFLAPDFLVAGGDELILADSLLKKVVIADDTNVFSKPGQPYSKQQYHFSREKPVAVLGDRRFFFDPNSASVAEWMSMGVRQKTASTIKKYLQSGGRFRSSADLDKIYGLPATLAQELKPYVRLTTAVPELRERNYIPKPVTPSKIDINLADSALWEGLPGIGAKLASRIVFFRSRLGGFYSISQVAEVYGLQDTVFRKIEPRLEIHESSIQLIAINTATLEEMAAHPYIRKMMANAIIQYRNAHGRFQTTAELLKIHLINEEQLEKLRPYCKLE
jgi:competence protein ComEA